MTVKLFIASTLDGYIATKEESLQWLFDVEGEGDNGYGAFYSDIDTIIMGKKTYDWLEKEQAGQWPYSDKTSYILTHQKISSTDNIVFIDKEKHKTYNSNDMHYAMHIKRCLTERKI